jgi:hypothetical protein
MQDLQTGNDPLEDIDNPSQLVLADTRSTMQHLLTDNDHDPLWLPVDPIITQPTLMGNGQ